MAKGLYIGSIDYNEETKKIIFKNINEHPIIDNDVIEKYNYFINDLCDDEIEGMEYEPCTNIFYPRKLICNESNEEKYFYIGNINLNDYKIYNFEESFIAGSYTIFELIEFETNIRHLYIIVDDNN